MRGKVFSRRLTALANNQFFTEILCYSWNPEENPRWQHLSSPESFGVEYIKVTAQEEEEEQVEHRGITYTKKTKALLMIFNKTSSSNKYRIRIIVRRTYIS